MSNETIFRLLALRPAKKGLKKSTDFNLESENLSSTDFFTKIKEDYTNGVKIVEAKEFAKNYIESKDFKDFLKSEELNKIKEWLVYSEKKKLSEINLEEEVLAVFKTKDKLKEFTSTLRDGITANSVTKQNIFKDELVSITKLLQMVIESTPNKKNGITLGQSLSNSKLILPQFLNNSNLKQEEQEEIPEEEEEGNFEDEIKKIREKMEIFGQAKRELSRLVSFDGYRKQPKITKPPKKQLLLETRILDLEKVISSLPIEKNPKDRLTPTVIIPTSPPPIAPKEMSEYILTKNGLKTLSDTTKNLIKEYNINTEKINPVKLIQIIEEDTNYFGSKLIHQNKYNKIVSLGGVFLDQEKFKESIGINKGKGELVKKVLDRCKFEVGVGDLLKVVQTLKAYELSEFAHTENVLAGELRERSHRRLNIREEEIFIEQESESETERNLQSTEKNELQKESEKYLQSQMSLDAGLQISGSYGPSVSFAASLDTSFSTVSEEVERKASRYSRDVTEKISERIRERTTESRRNRTIEEIEELNKHIVNNSDAKNGHVRGIYRWLNKVYDAQVKNYGQRMMFEFVIPEPASFYLYAYLENPPNEAEIIKPKAPVSPIDNESPLKPYELTPENYYNYISEYQVTGVKPPPSYFKVYSYFEKHDGSSTGNISRANKIAIEPNYEGYAARVSSAYVHEKNYRWFRIYIGGKELDRKDNWNEYVTFEKKYRNEIAISLEAAHIQSFSVGIDVFCQLTNEGWNKWKLEVYDAIMEAYYQQKAEYEDKLAALSIQEGINIEGNNPLENRKIEREELKKWIIMLLRHNPELIFNSFHSGDEPKIDIEKAMNDGATIQFFENAFEWNNMLYVFYPYFWGRKSKWISAIHLTDKFSDSDFVAFLKAGAARVQLPVRPGYEKAISYFCQFGEIWNGNDVPLRDDDLYVPIVDEIIENLGKLDEGIPYPENSKPWEIRIPTSLVVLQDLDEISGIKDTLTGNDIDITPDDN